MNNFQKLWKSYINKKTLQENVEAAESALETAKAKLKAAQEQQKAIQTTLALAQAEVSSNQEAVRRAKELEAQAQNSSSSKSTPATTGPISTSPTKMEEAFPGNAAGNPSDGSVGSKAVPYSSQEYMDISNANGPDNLALEEKDCGVYEAHDENGEKCYMQIEYEDLEEEKACGKCETCMEESKLDEAKYQGRTVSLNKPMKGDVKKFKVYVKDPSTGNIKKVNFGDKKMRIKKSNPARRRSFRARHRCSNPGPKTKARYWSCRKW